MILVDTNVIAEPMRSAPNPAVADWWDRQDPTTLHLSTISLAEIRYGIALLPDGHRRSQLHERFETELLPHFAGRIIGFDDAASLRYARLRADARRQGIVIAALDGLIAATASAHQLSIATRDVTPFFAAGLHVINPFEL
ncbi:type II toxin-antitoxin system VapC family toxin [Microbacterium sp. A93]|uniref:type II toxin-antitoxin system VapC family toxin n=1 Tax=unclassified Microbacterium TaxID=2609290 RepID=UPI003F42936D